MTQQFQQLEKRKFMSTRGLHISVHSGVIHRSQHMETTQHLQTAQGSEMQKHSVWYDSATGANCELTTMCKNQRHKEKDASHKRHSLHNSIACQSCRVGKPAVIKSGLGVVCDSKRGV